MPPLGAVQPFTDQLMLLVVFLKLHSQQIPLQNLILAEQPDIDVLEDSEEKIIYRHDISLVFLFRADVKAFSFNVFVMMDLKEERVVLDLSEELRRGAWSVEGSEW